MPEWKKAGGLILSAPEYLMDMMKNEASFVLIDLGSAKASRSGHIDGAVNIPSAGLNSARGMFPQDKSAVIVMYDGDGMDTASFDKVRSWGYKNASLMSGGLKGWSLADGKLINGEPATEIVYVKRLPRGVVSIDEFRSAVDSGAPDKLILDARDDTSGGMLPGAVAVSMAELDSKLASLPRDREMLIHCNTGVLAASMYKELTARGYKARYLDAVVQIDMGKGYEISEK